MQGATSILELLTVTLCGRSNVPGIKCARYTRSAAKGKKLSLIAVSHMLRRRRASRVQGVCTLLARKVPSFT